MQIKILDKRLTQGTFKPSTDGSAAIDLYACIDEKIILYPGGVIQIPVGFALNMQDRNIAGLIIPRSGKGTEGLVLANGTGLIDSDYQGQIFVALHNRSRSKAEYFNENAGSDASLFVIRPYDRIAQLFFVPIIHPTKEFVSEFNSKTERGEGGFGSTDIQDKERLALEQLSK